MNNIVYKNIWIDVIRHKKLCNYRHSSLWNIIEKYFGVLKT